MTTLARASGRSVRAWHRAFVARWLLLDGRGPVAAAEVWDVSKYGPIPENVTLHSGECPISLVVVEKDSNESDPAGPGGCDTLIQAQQRTARRPTQDELLAMPRAARVAALEACIA